MELSGQEYVGDEDGYSYCEHAIKQWAETSAHEFEELLEAL
jgi:hypothetical protein